MKILILGAKGNLGTQLAKVFTDGNDVVAWDREEVDITDKELVFKKVADIKPEIIINAVAYNAVDNCETDEGFALAKKLNADAVSYLAEAALENNALLIHYSTNYVFYGDKKEGYKEDDKPKPIDKYGESKLMGEKEIISAGNKGLKYYLIRTSKLFGPKGESELSKLNFFEVILELSKEQETLKLVDEEVSCFTYTPDLALATKNLIESEVKKGIYHITNVGRLTWYEAILELAKIKNLKNKIIPIKSSELARTAKRPAYSALLNTKLPMLRSFTEALREYFSKK